jgi:SAM-dependent methyltransferase
VAEGFKDHFSGHSDDYATYRPSYPPTLAAYLAEFAPANKLALECGCGSGQLTVLLAEHFDRVIATDASAKQIENAEARPNIDYRAAPAEQTGLDNSSADLITVAQAVHWFDLDAFYAEVRRVARPGAALVLITYGVMRIDPAIDGEIDRFYRDTVGDYWPPERHLVEDGYRSLPFPFVEETPPDIAMEADWPHAAFAGYIGTWSAVRRAHAATGIDPMEGFRTATSPLWGDESATRRVRWPLSLRVGRLP